MDALRPTFVSVFVSLVCQAVRGEVHATVRKTLVDWLLSEDDPPDIKLYVTGHSMGGALATHCAMDLKVRVCLSCLSAARARERE